MAKGKKANRSSIVRIIISKFNHKGIKEIKVLYNKQGGVDTFVTETKVEDGKVVFTKFEEKKREFADKFDISPRGIESRGKEVIKRVNNKITRQYRISGEVNEKNPQEIILKVEDINVENEKLDKRRRESETKRLLLDEELMERYAQLADCSIDEIDSQKIYKVKRFLSYRSNMLIYFQFINDFLTKNTDTEEIWKLLDKNAGSIDDEIIESISKDILNNYITKEIENHNNRAKKINEKNKDKRFKEKIESIGFIELEEFKKDIKKTIYLFADLRHRLMHYEYKYFEGLFEGEEVKVEVEKQDNLLEEVLDLNLFRELSKISQLKEENKTNYLDDDSVIRVLGKDKKAKKTYKLYSMICNRKNGFNKFINSIFVTDGLEDPDLKKLIRVRFENRLDWLEAAIKTKKIGNKSIKNDTLVGLKKELKEKKKILKLVGEPYAWDIHQSRAYKDLYNLRKDRVAQLSKLIAVGKNEGNKVAITKLNKELLELKNEMEEITKLNSKMRLETKMQVAFGFLITNFGIEYTKTGKNKKKERYRKIDLDKFLDEEGFNPSNINQNDIYREMKEKYLNCDKNSFDRVDKIDFDFGQLEKRVGAMDFFLFNKKENNLSKFYILMYLFLPVEMRGDLLGFVKKHYYDIKNIDFVDIEEKSIEEKQDKFFHNLRLFEKNSKKFEIINYGIIDFNNLREDFDRIYEKFGLDVAKLKVLEERVEGEVKIFDKNIILPIMKYYQHIFKLFNDIEIHALFKYAKDENMDLNGAIIDIKKFSSNNQLNFSVLMGKVGVKNKNLDKSIALLVRNDIAHLDYNNLFLNLLLGELLEKVENGKKIKRSVAESSIPLNSKIEKVIQRINLKVVDEVNLGITFINDFYQRKEQFIYNQKQQNVVGIVDSKRKEKFEKENKLLNTYKLNSNNLDGILKKYLELIGIDEETPIINNKKMKFLGEVEILLPKNKDKKAKSSKKIKEIEWFEEEEYKSNIMGKINRDSSDLLGIYKKYMVKGIKDKLINLFIKGERRYLNLQLYNKTMYNQIKKRDGEDRAREMSTNLEFNNSKEDIITVVFDEGNHLDWFDKGFTPKFNYGIMNKEVKEKIKRITGKDIKENFDEENQVFIYESPYDGKKIRRNILNGTLSSEENYMGMYVQKIKGLY